MKKYYVGKPKRKLAIILMSINMALDLLYLYCYLNPVSPESHHYIGMEFTSLVIIVGLFLITFLVVGPVFYSTYLWWSVDEKRLQYCHYSNYLSRFKAFYLPKHSQHYFISLNTQEIESITLSWQNVSKLVFGIYSHPIYFLITMSDGTELYIEALLGKNSKDFIKAVDFMKSQGIQFDDPYHLLEVIAHPQKSVGQYIENIEKRGRHHD